MKEKTVLTAGLVVAIGVAVASVAVLRRGAAREGVQQKADVARMKEPQRPAVTPVVETTAPEMVSPEPASPPPAPRVKAALPPLAPTPQAPSLNNPTVKEQYGRLALSYVGADPDAEDAWIQVINDPSLVADARRELIEDLNQDGFREPRNPGMQDLSLILNRIQLIEELAPDAMDQVNWDAFMEAYKDLVNMAVRLSGQGGG